jgi:hypothetical protein
VYATKRLAECWKDCPKPSSVDTTLPNDREFDAGEEDARFLADLGVKLPESR